MKFIRCLAACPFLAFFLSAASAVPIEIQYQDPAGSGFFDNTSATAVGGNTGATLGAQRRIALEYALLRWGKNIQGSIAIRVKAISLSTPRSSLTLASARPLAFRADWTQGTPPPLAGVAYPSALSTELAGVDIPDNAGSTYDIQVNNIPAWDTTTPGDSDQRVWYYGLDSNTPSVTGGKDFDFVGVMLHELCHGLGFSASLLSDGSYAFGVPDVWDTKLTDGAGNALTAMSQSSRAAMIIGNNLYTGGSILRSHNNNNRAKVFAPNPYQAGSSTSHFDETTYSGTGSLNEMMTPVNNIGTQVFGPLVLDLLQDMGYQMADTLPPVAGIDVPVSGRSFKSSPTPLFSGTATDTAAAGNNNAAGLLAVKLALYGNSQGKWYNWGTGTFDSGTFTYANHTTPATLNNLPIAVGSRGWSMAMPAGLPEGGYQLGVTAVDQINQGSEFIYNNFAIDNTASPIQVTPFADNAQVFDLKPMRFVSNGAQSVTVQISKVTGGVTTVWNGSAWVSGTAPALATSQESAGVFKPSFNLPSRADWPAGSALTIVGKSVDAASNVATATIHLTRTAQDSSVPDVTVASLASGTVFTQAFLPALSGTASDLQSGIKSVTISLARFVSGGGVLFWNGSDWSATPTDLPTSYDAGSGIWSAPYNWALPSNSSLPNASYSMQVTATNGESPGGSRGVGVSFSVDHHEVYTWTGATFRDSDPDNDSHFWGTAENWYPYGVPDVGDIAVIDNGDQVDSSISRAVHGLRLINGGLNFINGPGPLGTLTTTGSSNWASGLINGIWNNQSGATIDLTGSAAKRLAPDTVLNNSGTINCAAGNTGFLYDNAGTCTINNLTGGTFNLAGDGSPFENYYGPNTFNNAGTFARTGGTGPLSIHSWTFNNTGTIRSDSSALQFDGQLNLNSGTTFAGTTPIRFNGFIHANAPVTIPTNVSLVGGIFYCPAGAAISGTLEWLDGVIDGTLNIPAGATLKLTGASLKALAPGTVLNNSGIIDWTAGGTGYLRDNAGSCTINNLSGGTFNAAGDGSPFENYYGPNTFNNAGTFARTGGTGPLSIHSWTFNNTGTIRSDSSALQFDGQLNLNSGTTFAGTTPIRFNGFIHANAPVTIPTNVSLVGGIFYCPAGAAINGTLEWLDGVIDGTLNIPAGATLKLTGAALKALAPGTVLNNSGIIDWTAGGTGYLRDNAGSCTINNLSGGTFNAAGDGSPFENYYGPNTFNNAGTFARTGGTAPLSIHSWIFNNTAIIRSDSSVLQFDGTLNVAGGSTFAGSAPIRFNGAIHANAPVTIPATVSLVGGNFFCPAGALINGILEWSDGVIDGTLNIPAGATLKLTGTSLKALAPGTVLNNSGTIDWTAGGTGYLRDNAGSCTINNLSGGTFNAAGDSSPFENYYGPNTFNNVGTFVRTGGTDPLVIHSWIFNNTGIIRSNSSVLRFDGLLNLNAGTTFTGTSPIHFNGAVHANAPVTIPTTVSLIGGVLYCPVGAAVSGTLEWSDGVIDGTLNIPSGATLKLTGTAVKPLAPGTVLNNSGTIDWTAGGTGYLRDNAGSCTINNLTGGTFNAAGDGSPFENYYGPNVFNNAGTFLKSAGAGTTNVHAWAFNNSYKITANSGAVVFDGGTIGLNAGGLVTGSNEVHFRGGTTVLRGSTTCSGGHGVFDGTNLIGHADGTGTLAGGRWDWSAGIWSADVNVAAGGNLFITGATGTGVDFNASIQNAGSITCDASASLLGYGNSHIHNKSGATFNATGAAGFTNYYGGNSFINDGSLVIGAPLAQWTLAWDFIQSAGGALSVEVSGPSAAQFDRLAISGTATLGGAVNVTRLGGYAPAVGTTFEFLTAGNVVGTFATTSGGFVTDYTSTTATLRATSAGLTFATWVAAAGLSGANALPGADPDHDGMTNFAEYVFNTVPTAANVSQLTLSIVTISSQKWLTLDYRRWTDREQAGVIFTPQSSTNMVNWGGTGLVNEASPTAPVIAGSSAYRCRIPIGGAEKFLHVKAEQP